ASFLEYQPIRSGSRTVGGSVAGVDLGGRLVLHATHTGDHEPSGMEIPPLGRDGGIRSATSRGIGLLLPICAEHFICATVRDGLSGRGGGSVRLSEQLGRGWTGERCRRSGNAFLPL